MMQTSNPDRTVPTRRISFEESLRDLPKHFAADGDLILSHIAAVALGRVPRRRGLLRPLGAPLPRRDHRPGAQAQVNGFIGQEAMHGREHRAFNDRLAELGYPTKQVEKLTKWGLELREKIAPAKANLAATAALEHFTATLAELVLTDEETRNLFGDDAVRDLFTWHALEESEHKAVAFDVYKAVGGTERMRVWTMTALRYGFVLGMVVQVAAGLLFDRETYRRGKLRKSLKNLRHTSIYTQRRELWRQLKDYNRPDFHPDDSDTTELVETWTKELFGEHGTLNDKLVGIGSLMEHGSTSTSWSSAPACPASAPATTSRPTARGPRTPSSRRAPPSAAPGTCSATRASGPTPTCTRSATRSGRGTARSRSPTARRSCSTSRTPPRSRASTSTSGSTTASPRADWSTEDALLARHRRAHRHRRDRRAHRRVPLLVQRLLPLRPRLPARTSRARTASPGQIIHPQFWPEDLDYAGKRVVVIGSGATAITLIPSMAETGRPRHDAPALADLHRVDAGDEPASRRLFQTGPAEALAGDVTQWVHRARHPGLLRRQPARPEAREADPAPRPRRPSSPRATTSTPTSPRRTTRGTSASASCPNGDLFKAIKKGTASVVTDHIDTFTERGILLESGAELEADIIVTATGLELLFVGGVEVTVDGEKVDLPNLLTYKGMMLEGVPNVAMAIGYTNASWTLKCDLTCQYVTRLVNHMHETGLRQCTAVNSDPTVTPQPLLGPVVRLRHPVGRQVPEAGLAVSRGRCTRATCATTARCGSRASTTTPWCSPTPPSTQQKGAA